MCLAREMLGPLANEAVMEMNASDARGIDVVRNKIKMFAQQKVTLPPGRHKIIILVSFTGHETRGEMQLPSFCADASSCLFPRRMRLIP